MKAYGQKSKRATKKVARKSRASGKKKPAEELATKKPSLARKKARTRPAAKAAKPKKKTVARKPARPSKVVRSERARKAAETRRLRREEAAALAALRSARAKKAAATRRLRAAEAAQAAAEAAEKRSRAAKKAAATRKRNRLAASTLLKRQMAGHAPPAKPLRRKKGASKALAAGMAGVPPAAPPPPLPPIPVPHGLPDSAAEWAAMRASFPSLLREAIRTHQTPSRGRAPGRYLNNDRSIGDRRVVNISAIVTHGNVRKIMNEATFVTDNLPGRYPLWRTTLWLSTFGEKSYGSGNVMLASGQAFADSFVAEAYDSSGAWNTPEQMLGELERMLHKWASDERTLVFLHRLNITNHAMKVRT